MAAQNMNRFIFCVGVLGVIAIAAIAFILPLVRNSTRSSKDIINLETTCWTPRHFGGAQVRFANAVCNDEVRHNKTQPLPPPGYEDDNNVYTTDIKEDGATINNIEKPSGECFTFLFLTAEIVLLFVFYFVMPKKDEDVEHKLKECLEQGQEVKVRSRSKMHVAVYLLMAACFAFLSVAPHVAVRKTIGKPTYHSGQALCTFQIRQLRSINTYTLQCFYSYEEPSGVNMQRALMLNTALCGIIAVMSLLSIRPFRKA